MSTLMMFLLRPLSTYFKHLLLFPGTRQLGNVVSGHVSDLLSEMSDLKSTGGLAALNNKDGEGKTKGTLNDWFTKEALVLVAPIKPKGGGELQLNDCFDQQDLQPGCLLASSVGDQYYPAEEGRSFGNQESQKGGLAATGKERCRAEK